MFVWLLGIGDAEHFARESPDERARVAVERQGGRRRREQRDRNAARLVHRLPVLHFRAQVRVALLLDVQLHDARQLVQPVHVQHNTRTVVMQHHQ